MKKILILLLFIFFCSNSSLIHAQPLTKEESTRKLISLLGAKDYIHQMIQLYIENIKDDQVRLKVSEILDETKKIQFDELLIPTYQKYLTEDEIDKLNSFFESPTGKKIIKIELLVLQKSVNLDDLQWIQNRKKIFNEQMTAKDQKILNDFYKSAAGQKYLKVEPAISNEAGLIGEDLFKQILQNYRNSNLK